MPLSIAVGVAAVTSGDDGPQNHKPEDDDT
jgi:hypothetical protein